MINYPRNIITAYASRQITKQQFIKQLSDWQKSNGIDYDCKGVSQHGFIGVTYRGVNAVIRNGVLEWVCGECRDPKKGNRRFIRDTANSFFEFRRKVDFEKNGGGR